jgi:hypothetical protein
MGRVQVEATRSSNIVTEHARALFVFSGIDDWYTFIVNLVNFI